MRPDDDYDDLAPEIEEAPRSRAMSWLVLAVAVGGFAALFYYAYYSGSKSAQDGEVLVVEADDAPIKQTPENPEGEQFANQDKTIYDVISPNAATQETGEKLLPDPEEPVIIDRDEEASAPAAHAPAPTTYVSKEIATAAPAVDPVDASSLKPADAIAPLAPAEPKKAEPVVAPLKKVETPVEPLRKADVPAKTGAPTFVNEAPVVTKKEAPAVAPAPAPVKKPAAPEVVKKPAAPAAAAAPASGGSYKVQLGAFKSEAEARATWGKITSKFAGTISGSPIIVKADLPNGTFYRLRASGFASPEAAKAACAKLAAAKQACFPAGK